MIDIRFNTGRGDQAIYTGECECGNGLVFTPGGNAVICPKCSRRWVTDITAVADVIKPDTNPVSKKVGPSERKSKAIV